MGNPIGPLILAVYNKLKEATVSGGSLYGKLGRSWMVELYPKDSSIEANGVYMKVPEGSKLPMIVLDEVFYTDDHELGSGQLYHVDMTIFVYDGKPNSIEVATLSGYVEDLLEDDELVITGYDVVNKHIRGEFRRMDFNMFYVELHLEIDMSPVVA